MFHERLDQRTSVLRVVGPDIRREALPIEQFSMENSKAGDVVDVIPLREEMHRDIQVYCPMQRLPRDLVCAPGDVLEQSMVFGFQAKQIIAAVARWPQNYSISGFGEHPGCLGQQCTWQGRTVAIDDDRAAMAEIQQPCNDVKQAIPKIRIPGVDQTNVAGKVRLEKRFCSR